MDHLTVTRSEFARQAETLAASPNFTDETLLARFRDAVGPGEIVLDLACGPGIVTAALADEARAITAFDLTPEMLAKARQRCGGRTNVTFVEGSATELPFPDRSFQSVVTRLAVHHFADPRRVFEEIHRVLTPGGTLVLADVVGSEDPEAAAVQNAIEVLRDPSHVRMLPISELSNLIERAGLDVESRSTWDKRRECGEWMSIVNDAARVAPLTTLLHALARAGVTAGMDLAIVDDRLTFVHRWHMIVARKRAG